MGCSPRDINFVTSDLINVEIDYWAAGAEFMPLKTLKDLMPDTTITNEMKRHAVIVSMKAEHRNLEIARFPKVATSSPCKVRKEQPNDNNANELAITRMRKWHCQLSADSLTTPAFVRRVHGMMNENPGKTQKNRSVFGFSPTKNLPQDEKSTGERKDSVANVGRLLYVFQQDPPPSQIALKTHNSMDVGELSSSCHTKLLMAP
ncbi:hypothetical protein ACTXT7_002136 [Hymenolepis weldensis]